MRLRVEFLGRCGGRGRAPPDLDVSDGLSIVALLGTLGYAADELRHFSFLVNGGRASADTLLEPEDKLSVLLMVGGG